MTSDETINLLKTLSETVDTLASFTQGKEAGKKGGDDDKLDSSLSSTEKRRWQTMSLILAKAIKDVVFPKGEEKVGRPEFKAKEIPDLVLSPTFAKVEEASNKWLAMILGALAILGGIIAGAIAEIGKMLKGLKLFLSETKLGKLIKDIFSFLKSKLLQILKPIREMKLVKFIEGLIGKNIIQPISKFFQTIGRLFKVIEAGKGPLLMMKAFPTFFKYFDDYIRIFFKTFQIGIKFGRVFAKFLGPVGLAISAIFELIMAMYQAFSDPKLSDKSFFQKIITGFTQGFLNFFDFFEIFGLDLFKFDTIRDRIETIFKTFREGNFLQGLLEIGNQLSSVILSIPGKILGYIIGFFDKELGENIMAFFDKFDLGKFYSAIAKRISNIFEPIMIFFKSIEEKMGPILGFLFKALGGPVYLAFIALKKVFEYVVPLMNGISSLVSKVFGYIKNFFVMIFDTIKSLADKISKIPFMKGVADELKAIASESQTSEMATPVITNTPNIDVSSGANMDNENNSNPFSTFTNGMNSDGFDFKNNSNPFSTFTNGMNSDGFDFKNMISKDKNDPSKAFSAFGDQMGDLNKTNSVNNKIAVDQLREFKTLNQKFDMLMEQLLNGRNIVNNVINQSTQNSFPQSTSVFELRQGYRGN